MNEQELRLLMNIQTVIDRNSNAITDLVRLSAEQIGLLRPPDLVALRREAESGKVIPYEIRSFSLTTARTNVEVSVEGEFVQAWTDGNYAGIGVRFNNERNDLVYFQRRNPVRGFKFWKLYLTHTAQSGKTLDLLILREGAVASLVATSRAISKTIETELQAIATLDAGAQAVSSELDLSGQEKQVTILIDHAKDHASASVGQGTEYVVQVSQKASGNDTWRTLAAFTAAITAPTAMVSDAEEAAGQTVIECGVVTPVVGDILFFKNSTIGSSEWANVIARSDGVSVTLESGLTNVQAAGTYYTQGESFVVTIDVKSITRLRVVANNTKGTTNRPVVFRVAAITVE